MCSVDLVVNNPTSVPVNVGLFYQGYSAAAMRTVSPNGVLLIRAPLATGLYVALVDGASRYDTAVLDGTVAIDWIFRSDAPVGAALLYIPVAGSCDMGKLPQTVQSVVSPTQTVLSAEVRRANVRQLDITVERKAQAEPARHSSVMLGFMVALAVVAALSLGVLATTHSHSRRRGSGEGLAGIARARYLRIET